MTNQEERATKRRIPLFNVIGAGVLVVVAALALTRAVLPLTAPPPSPSATTSSASVPYALDPALAVQGYLDALASGDAGSALAYAVRPPADLLMLTDTALAASLALAPITRIHLASGAGTGTGAGHRRVGVSYTLGDTTVRTAFEVSRVAGVWLLDKVAIALPLDLSPAAGVALTVNGTPLARKLPLVFPGRYRVDAVSPWYRIIDGTVDVVTTSTGDPPPKLRLAVSPAGVSAIRTAARQKLAACLAEKSLAPAGCGFSARLPDGTAVRASTIRWQVVGDAATVDVLRPRLRTPGAATAEVAVQTRVRCVSTDGRHWSRSAAIRSVNADLAGGTVEVTFGG